MKKYVPNPFSTTIELREYDQKLDRDIWAIAGAMEYAVPAFDTWEDAKAWLVAKRKSQIDLIAREAKYAEERYQLALKMKQKDKAK